MISVQPTALNSEALTANQQSLLLTITEGIAPRVCVSGAPTFTTSYQAGTPVLNDETVYVPITITVTGLWPTVGNNAITKLYKEQFVAAFQGNSSADVTVTVASEGSTTEKVLFGFEKKNQYSVYESITVAIKATA